MRGKITMQKKQNGNPDTSKNSDEAKHTGNSSVSLNKAAYSKILQWIFEGKLVPGSFMSQSELSKLMDIPTQPLRDALRVLESENMLIIHPRSGIQFRKPDLEFIRNTYQFRSIIESAAARHFAQYGQDELFSKLLQEHQKLIGKVESKGITPDILNEVEALELKFHGTMIASLKNEFVEITAKRLKYYIRLIQLEHHFTPTLVTVSLMEHIDILEACINRKPEVAAQALFTHFKEALHRHMKLF
jgi:DNA-binding GntR family transcriptional regulator